jgi:hydrogenase nickel incorporation protein HypA/HybF
MQTALELACDEAQRAGAVGVRRVVLRVGAASGVVLDALRFAFDALSPGTLADGAALEIEEVADGTALELARVEVVVP